MSMRQQWTMVGESTGSSAHHDLPDNKEPTQPAHSFLFTTAFPAWNADMMAGGAATILRA